VTVAGTQRLSDDPLIERNVYQVQVIAPHDVAKATHNSTFSGCHFAKYGEDWGTIGCC
jgi:hypothetical protein